METKLDGKPFGFPFDRKMAFKLSGKQKYVKTNIFHLIINYQTIFVFLFVIYSNIFAVL